MGGEKVQKGRKILKEHGYPAQATPKQSVRTFMYLNRYARNSERLLETPEELSVDKSPPKHNIKAMIRRIARNDREVLTETESKKILQAYGIPSPEIHLAESKDKAQKLASKIGFPVVMKIQSLDITHRAKVGEVALNVNSKGEVRQKYEEIMEKVKKNAPSAEIEGITVQKMVEDSDYEIIFGSKRDPIFGSTLMFGRGGTEVEFFQDTVIGLPPLNQTLARLLMDETKIFDQIKEDGNSEQLIRNLEKSIVGLSQLIIDFPEIVELDVNPVTFLDGELTALDGLVKIDKDLVLGEPNPEEFLAIKPYPREYVEEWELRDERNATLRPIRPEDESLESELFETLSEDTWEKRFFGPIQEVDHKDMVRFTNIDYRREMAIVGILEEDGEKKMIGVGRLVIDPNGDSGEYAVVVGSVI